MTKQEIKKVLLAKQKELGSRQVKREDIAIQKNAEVLDEIQQNADRTIALDSLTRNWETASLISEALRRVEDGTYGTCAECDEPVSERRLTAIPWAKYCLRCQEAVDKSNADTRWAEAA
jgi:DnaK suppressor protein